MKTVDICRTSSGKIRSEVTRCGPYQNIQKL
jgi:hypothetical protein